MRVRSMWGKLISFVVVISIFMQCIPVSERSAKAWTGNRVSTFEELVEACKMNNTILLTEDIVFTSAIDVPEGRNITIKGDGHTMSVETPNLDEDGNLNVNPSDFSLFNITNKIVTMKFSDVIMIGGSKPALAASYICGKYTFEEVLFTRSSCAINMPGTLYMKGCRVENNVSTTSSILYGLNRLFIDNSSFSGNLSTCDAGVIGNSGALYVNNSTFCYNRGSYGGAIRTSSSSAHIQNSNFFGNVSSYEGTTGSELTGGAIYSFASLRLYNSIVTNNYVYNKATRAFMESDIAYMESNAYISPSDDNVYLYNSIVSMYTNDSTYQLRTPKNGLNGSSIQGPTNNVNIYKVYEEIGVKDFSGSSYVGYRDSFVVRAPKITIQPNGTLAAEYCDNSKALTGGCDTQFYKSADNSTIHIGLLVNEESKVKKYQGGGKRVSGVVGAGGTYLFDVDISPMITEGSVVCETNSPVYYSRRVDLTITPDRGYGLQRLYYTTQRDNAEVDIEIDTSVAQTKKHTVTFDMPEVDIVIHAEFAPAYGITYESNGGSQIETTYYFLNKKINEPSGIKPGCVFEGWFTDEACTSAFNFETETVQKDMKLYAKWSEGQYYSTQETYSQNRHYYSVWDSPDRARLIANDNGTFTRVESLVKDGAFRILVEEYNAEYQLCTQQYLDMDLPIYGGFYSGKEYNFFLFGQNNLDEDDEREVLKLVRYSKSFEKLEVLSISGINTTKPFNAGSVDFLEYDGYLFIHTSHEMYKYSDGLNHQSNMKFQIDITSPSGMSVTDSFTGIYNTSRYGYVSHSFSQFIDVLPTGQLVALDHGDALPRYICLSIFDEVPAKHQMISANTIPVQARYISKGSGNITYTSIGGMAVSNTSIFTVGTQATVSSSRKRSAYLSITSNEAPYDTRGIGFNAITGATIEATTPYIVKVTEDRFVVMYGNAQASNGEAVSKFYDGVYYHIVDGNGNELSNGMLPDANLSDCEPIVKDGVIHWFITDNEGIVFYTLDLDGNSTLSRRCYEHTWDKDYEYLSNTDSFAITKTCEACGIIERETILKDNLVFTEQWVCDEDYHWKVCITEGYQYIILDQTEHDLKRDEVDPTCTESGALTIQCAQCSYVVSSEEQGQPTGHSFGVAEVKESPTCTQKGSEEATCNVCLETDIREIPALEHDYSDEWTTTLEPTCTKVGSKQRQCLREQCSEFTKVTSIPALGHTFGDSAINKDATCTEPGLLEGVCEVCAYSTSEEIPQLDHSYDEGVITKEATCTTKGKKTYSCIGCEMTRAEDIAVLGHNYETGWTTDRVATCLVAGSKSHHCMREGCSGKSGTTTIAARGHSWDTGTVTKAATYTATGVKRYNCKNCTSTKTSTIAKLTYKTYTIRYDLNGGTTSDYKTTSYTMATNTFNLVVPKRTGYTFAGWYLEPEYITKITSVLKGSSGDLKVYAKWDAVTVPKASINKLKNLSRLKVKVTMKKYSGVVGYEVMCSSKKNMKKNVKRNTFNASSGTLTVAKKGTIYVKARVYKLDSAGYKVYGKWSSIKKVKVKK